MNYYIGIDLGTSSVKLMLVKADGEIVRTVSREYPLECPSPGWSQQNPCDWKTAVFEGIPELTEGIDPGKIKGIGVGGQMHGLVILDDADNVIRPVILWNDGRTAKETDWLNEDKEFLLKNTANIAFAGFTAPKLLWIRENEPENWRRIAKVMLPKDYINYCLTGIHSCDFSDAAGTLLLDVKNKRWSEPMLSKCGICENVMPRLYESLEVIGEVRPEIASRLGLPLGVQVVAGAGDNAAAAIGTGTVGEGRCNISLGTSGTIFISSKQFSEITCPGIHNFAHADGGFHLMGCMLSAASCNKWLYEDILESTDYDGLQGSVAADRLGHNHVYFLPYLMGERSPINDTDARGTFIGLTMDTSRSDMVQAVMEGVAFAIRDSFEEVKKAGIEINRSTICGGGAKAGIWLTIMANVLGIPLDIPETEQGPGYGGAILAMVGCGEYESVEGASRKLAGVRETIYPEKHLTELYDARYDVFKKIYPALKPVFKVLGGSHENS